MNILNTQEILKTMDMKEGAVGLLEAKLKYRPLLEIGRSYLFKERMTSHYFEGKVIKYGAKDIDADGGEERFALVKLSVDGKGQWWFREILETQEQFPSEYEDGY